MKRTASRNRAFFRLTISGFSSCPEEAALPSAGYCSSGASLVSGAFSGAPAGSAFTLSEGFSPFTSEESSLEGSPLRAAACAFMAASSFSQSRPQAWRTDGMKRTIAKRAPEIRKAMIRAPNTLALPSFSGYFSAPLATMKGSFPVTSNTASPAPAGETSFRSW